MTTRTLLPLTAACVALAAPVTAEAAYPGGKGNITVGIAARDRGGEGYTNLKLMSRKAEHIATLVHCAYHEFEDTPDEQGCPSGSDFSRSGRKLAVSIDGRLAVMDADGSNRVLLPQQTDFDDSPAWTRGGRLVFTGKRGGARNLFVVDADGTDLRQITYRGGRTPAYSNGGLIAYVARGYVRVVRPDGRGGRRFARGDDPDFSPSGKTIVYSGKGKVWRKRVRPGGKRELVARRGSDPVFSPDAKRVLFVALDRFDLPSNLNTISPKGKNRRRVYGSGGDPSSLANLFDPAWQPRR